MRPSKTAQCPPPAPSADARAAPAGHCRRAGQAGPRRGCPRCRVRAKRGLPRPSPAPSADDGRTTARVDAKRRRVRAKRGLRRPSPAPSADDGRTTARVDAKRRRASRSRRTSSTGRPSRTRTGMPARPSQRQARTPTAAGATIARARPVKRRLGPLKKTPCAGLNPSWIRRSWQQAPSGVPPRSTLSASKRAWACQMAPNRQGWGPSLRPLRPAPKVPPFEEYPQVRFGFAEPPSLGA